MKIAFRADASTVIGSGHIMRCLTLADTLRAQGDEILFLCREFPGNLNTEIERHGHTLHRLSVCERMPASETTDPTHSSWLGSDWQTDATECAVALTAWGSVDWLIADHYAIEQQWEKLMSRHCKKIMVIDDLADREHYCALLLDQNLQPQPERYKQRVPEGCRCLLGPHFALLRPEFHQLRQTLAPRNGPLQHLLVFLGGGDPDNFTSTVLHGILESGLGPDLHLDVILGAANPHLHEIEAICQRLPNTHIHIQTPNIAALMANADLMIGAAGTTTWERCCLGLPSLLVSLADNQQENGRQIARQRAALYLGRAKDTSPKQLSGMLRKLASRPGLRHRIAQRAFKITAGGGSRLLALTLHAEQTTIEHVLVDSLPSSAQITA